MKKYHGYLKPWEVARYLGLHLEEVLKMIEAQELPSTTINGELRVPWDQLEAWLDEEVDPQELRRLSEHLPDVDPEEVERFLSGQEEERS